MEKGAYPEIWDRENVAKLRKELSAYQHPNAGRSIWQLANTFIPYALTWAAAYWVMQYSYWLALPFILLGGGLVIRIFIIFHDCTHGSFFRNKRANEIWGFITGVLTFTPFYYWRSNHMAHHATSGNLDKRGEGDVWMMTVDEYRGLSFWRRLEYRLYRNPFVMFLLGPLLIFLVTHRLVSRKADLKEHLSVYGTNLGIVLVALAVSELIGFKDYLLIQLPMLYVGLMSGIWIFYVQHQFDGVYWVREQNWNFTAASLEGGSFYKLPGILRWFTGNIGYHHVHHLSPLIPNYYLDRCFKQVPTLQKAKPFGLISGLKALNYRLWDEERGKLVSFRAMKKMPRGQKEAVPY